MFVCAQCGLVVSIGLVVALCLHELHSLAVPIVQFEGSDFGHMYPQSTVDTRARYTQHDAQIDAGPRHTWEGRGGGGKEGGRRREEEVEGRREGDGERRKE